MWQHIYIYSIEDTYRRHVSCHPSLSTSLNTTFRNPFPPSSPLLGLPFSCPLLLHPKNRASRLVPNTAPTNVSSAAPLNTAGAHVRGARAVSSSVRCTTSSRYLGGKRQSFRWHSFPGSCY
ncbi:unnamed protein product [Chondrus crispus]|uniref:Uncharacterized protein n=1 Tax=Chondrus crispus TaxID=2769 RepID=R7QAI8_CHOCR|nr:unnamed protein product [Chondrus crispus]CDF35069.1 unnamed protein product [Chondrus crispus]|eukprot:XP_005714888.1 unnamed protein product [Chondrus crispus]